LKHGALAVVGAVALGMQLALHETAVLLEEEARMRIVYSALLN
jgi:hypothetical protein